MFYFPANTLTLTSSFVNRYNYWVTYIQDSVPIHASIHINSYKNSAEVDIAPAFGEITTAFNVGQAKKGHGACLKRHCCKEINFNSRLDVNFLDLTQNIDKVSGA